MRLETERLILRPFEDADAPAMLSIMNDPEVMHNLLSSPTFSEEDIAESIRRRKAAIEAKERYSLAVILKETGALMGACSLIEVSWEHMHAELVYYIGQEFWGKGYMTEAARRTIQFGFEELGLERISVGCFARNKASARIIEKLGFQSEGVARHAYRKDGEFLDELRFGMIRSDYHSSGG